MNNIQHLRYAVEVAKTGSISRAAENLFMGQPHLSKAIRELEEDMNITIFRRTPKGVEPTEQGEQFLEYARRILEQVDELESLYKPSGVKKFSLSLPRASYAAFAFSEFAAALDDAEGLDVKYRETNSTQVLKNVGDGVSNLGILRCQREHEKYFLAALEERSLKYEPVWEFEYLALMSRRHPLADAPELKYSELRLYTEIVHDDNSIPALPVSEARMLAQKHEKKEENRRLRTRNTVRAALPPARRIHLGLAHAARDARPLRPRSETLPRRGQLLPRPAHLPQELPLHARGQALRRKAARDRRARKKRAGAKRVERPERFAARDI